MMILNNAVVPPQQLGVLKQHHSILENGLFTTHGSPACLKALSHPLCRVHHKGMINKHNGLPWYKTL